jgi:glutaredoxin
MKVELLVSDWCAPCHQAERIWRQVAAERDFEFAVLDLAQPEGKALAQRLRIRTIPALVIDGRLAGVGVQSLEEARRLVAAAISSTSGSDSSQVRAWPCSRRSLIC